MFGSNGTLGGSGGNHLAESSAHPLGGIGEGQSRQYEVTLCVVKLVGPRVVYKSYKG